MLKPFTVDIKRSDTASPIKPFTIDYDYVNAKEKESSTDDVAKPTKEEHKETQHAQLQVQKIRPFDYIPDKVIKIADVMAANDEKLSRFFAEAVYKYVAEGGDVQQLIKKMKKNKKPIGFNFQVELKKIVSRIFDSSEGEIRDAYYGIEITVYKANGKTKIFYAEIESDKVKDYAWLKKATYSLATLPRTKDDKEILDRMLQECIESESAEPEWIYNRAGWRNITGKGWRYIFHDGIVGTQGTQIHTGGNFYSLMLRTNKLGMIIPGLRPTLVAVQPSQIALQLI